MAAVVQTSEPRLTAKYNQNPNLAFTLTRHIHLTQSDIMGKKKQVTATAAKQKAAKKAKVEKKAEKRDAKKTGGGKDDEEDLDAILDQVRVSYLLLSRLYD